MDAKQVKMVGSGFLLAMLLGSPVLAGSMEHDKMAGMDHSKMAGMDHSAMPGMGGDAKMIMLKDNVQDGVKAAVHLADITKAMADMGKKATHHFMVMFSEEKGGKSVTGGTVAVKVTDPAGATGEATKLMGMGDGFGADLILGKPGKYVFEVGTQLADGKKRQFHFEYIAK